MTDLRELLRPRVERGAALLDSVEPRWWERVSASLQMASCSRCVLGQTFGHFDDGVAAVGISGPHWYGFDVDPLGPAGVVDEYHALDALWLEAIAERRQS